jgi:serine O-acetyltransferase
LTQDVAPGSHVTQAVSRNEASQPAQVTLVPQAPQLNPVASATS